LPTIIRVAAPKSGGLPTARLRTTLVPETFWGNILRYDRLLDVAWAGRSWLRGGVIKGVARGLAAADFGRISGARAVSQGRAELCLFRVRLDGGQ
jgi:hypothetical protein